MVVSRGVGAVACTMLALLRPGDHLVSSEWLSAPVRAFLEHELPHCGITVTFINPTATRGWRRASRKNTRVMFLQSPVSETLRVVDMKPASMLAHELGIALVVDAAVATPACFCPLEHGADVVVHSSTALLCNSVLARTGAVSGTRAVVDEVRTKMTRWGYDPDADSLVVLESGLVTLEERMQRASTCAMAVARWAESRPEFAAVHYSGLPSHPDHEVARTFLRASGGVLLLELQPNGPTADAFVRRIPAYAHVSGAHEHTVRLDVATHVAADIIADLTNALG